MHFVWQKNGIGSIALDQSLYYHYFTGDIVKRVIEKTNKTLMKYLQPFFFLY